MGGGVWGVVAVKNWNRWSALLPQCLCRNTLYLVAGRVVLIEFLPSDTGPIATCVGAATGCGKPNTGAQVARQGGVGRGGVAFGGSHTARPICHVK